MNMKNEQTIIRHPGFYAVKYNGLLTIAELREDKSLVTFGDTNAYGEQRFSEISPYPINLETHLQYKNSKNLEFFTPEFLKTETLEKISERLNYLTNMHAKQSILIRDLKDTNTELQKKYLPKFALYAFINVQVEDGEIKHMENLEWKRQD